jgi:endonuclease YncB( thermonuclease family)
VTCDGAEFDRHERLLAYCHAGGVELNRWMVVEGWAVSFGGAFKTEELAARAAKRGIWQGEFKMPHVWRRENPRF